MRELVIDRRHKPRKLRFDFRSLFLDFARDALCLSEVDKHGNTENEKSEYLKEKERRNSKNAYKQRFRGGSCHKQLRCNLAHPCGTQIFFKLVLFPFVQLELRGKLGGKAFKEQLNIADLFIALSAEVVCCPARLHRRNLKHIKQNTSNAQGKDDPDK